MTRHVTAIIGFGEAGAAIAPRLNGTLKIYDRAVEAARTRTRTVGLPRLPVCDFQLVTSNREAVGGASAILSLVTADQAEAAAKESAAHLEAGVFYFDMNSVAPETKHRAAAEVASAGAHYLDVAVLAPVLPARESVPLLVSGERADEGELLLRSVGFTNVRIVPGAIGRASSIKMIRSVAVKGIEAITAECVLAATAAGVLDEVLTSLDASPPPQGWEAIADYNLDRMMVHGVRRSAEMEEVAKTLLALGIDPKMSRATAAVQRRIGMRALTPAVGLKNKLVELSAVEREGCQQ